MRSHYSLFDFPKRMSITLGLLLLIGIFDGIPIGGVDYPLLRYSFIEGAQSHLLPLNSSHMGMFYLGNSPYTSVSIIIQLISPLIPRLERLQKKEAAYGRTQVAILKRNLTVFMAAFQSVSAASSMQSYAYTPGFSFGLNTCVTLTTGSILLMWIGELITEYGLGNGPSFLISISLCKDVGYMTQDIWNYDISSGYIVFLILSVILVLVAVAYHELIYPISMVYFSPFRSKLVKSEAFLPLRLSFCGVSPLFFASTIASLPGRILSALPPALTLGLDVGGMFSTDNIFYMPVYFAAIIAVSFFYALLIINPKDLAENVNKIGGRFTAMHPGRETIATLTDILAKISFINSLYLIALIVIPNTIFSIFNIPVLGGDTITFAVLLGIYLEILDEMEGRWVDTFYDWEKEEEDLKAKAEASNKMNNSI